MNILGSLSHLTRSLSADSIEQALIADRNRNLVSCNKCSMGFVPELLATETESGGEYQRFTCPHCGEEYPVATITARGVKLRSQMTAVERILGRDDGDIRKWTKELKSLKKQLSREVKKGERPKP